MTIKVIGRRWMMHHSELCCLPDHASRRLFCHPSAVLAPARTLLVQSDSQSPHHVSI